MFNFVGSCLSFFDDFWLKFAVSVARNSYLTLPIIADYGLFAVTVATVSGVVSFNRILLIAEVFVHFRLEHLLNSTGKKPLQLRLNISCRPAIRHQQLYQFHFSFI